MPLSINYTSIKTQLQQEGFAIVSPVFSPEEVALIIDSIDNTAGNNTTFRKSADLFAIRQFLKEVPAAKPLVFTPVLTGLIKAVFGDNYAVVKAIYFDKPPASNWFVPYHQDLTISVKEKHAVTGFAPWTVKQNQYGVQPPVSLLQDIFTIRIHLDDTYENNGALRIIPGSHANGIIHPETIEKKAKKEVTCCVPKGGIMLMRPLLLHASGKTTNNQRRRVIHIECSSEPLPAPLVWAEFQLIEVAV